MVPHIQIIDCACGYDSIPDYYRYKSNFEERFSRIKEVLDKVAECVKQVVKAK